LHIGGKKRRALGVVYADDQEAAIELAMRVHKIPETSRNRVAVVVER
jgi:hypothetical protein